MYLVSRLSFWFCQRCALFSCCQHLIPFLSSNVLDTLVLNSLLYGSITFQSWKAHLPATSTFLILFVLLSHVTLQFLLVLFFTVRFPSLGCFLWGSPVCWLQLHPYTVVSCFLCWEHNGLTCAGSLLR